MTTWRYRAYNTQNTSEIILEYQKYIPSFFSVPPPRGLNSFRLRSVDLVFPMKTHRWPSRSWVRDGESACLCRHKTKKNGSKDMTVTNEQP